MFSPEVNDEFLRVCLNLLQLGPGLLQLTLIQESSMMQKILHSVHIQYTSQQRNKNQRMICYKCDSSGADWYILTKKTGAFYTKHDFFLYNTCIAGMKQKAPPGSGLKMMWRLPPRKSGRYLELWPREEPRQPMLGRRRREAVLARLLILLHEKSPMCWSSSADWYISTNKTGAFYTKHACGFSIQHVHSRHVTDYKEEGTNSIGRYVTAKRNLPEHQFNPRNIVYGTYKSAKDV